MITNTNSSERIKIETEYHESKLPARLLSVGEVAHFLGIHASTVRRWEKSGLLKSYAIGLRNNLRFKQEDVLSFLDKCQEKGTHLRTLEDDLDRERCKIKGKRR
jgi:excisionase family DNA binding protein